jgi:glycerol-3-phosphate dehydrogenase
MPLKTEPNVPKPCAARDRSEQLAAMAVEPLDVLVVGGGITGVGVALDAATRGLRVGIVERDDWACGTSSRSSKMIHGGLRYLASGDVGVVRESLRERARIQRNAEHRRAAGSLHEWRSLDQLTRLVPGIALQSPAGGGRLRGAQHYHDASADDVRLVLAVLRTALAHDALAANGTPVLRLLRDGERVVGAVVGGDAVEGVPGARAGELELEAKVVVNATGVWADEILRSGDSDAPVGFRVLPSKGIHLTVRRDRAGIESGIAFFEQTGNSNVFLEPWQDDLAFIGTTDAPYDGDIAAPMATDEEVDWLLGKVNQFLRTPLAREDVVSTWAGLRPLVMPDTTVDGASKDLSRRHLLVDRAGILTITGGKLTAYRSMAEHTVDAAMHQLGRKGSSQTRELRLEGSRPLALAAEVDDVATRLGIERTDARHLLRRHGTNVEHLLQLVAERPELAARVHPDRPYIAAEVVWAVSHEQARDVEDVLERRTRIALEVADPGRAAAAVEQLIGG